MKRVSPEVAKAIKDAGYPQDSIGRNIYVSEPNAPYMEVATQPTYYEVWDWLWREKKICINCNLDKYNLLPMWWCNNDDRINYNTPNFESPEEAISDAIEYLVENDLIK